MQPSIEHPTTEQSGPEDAPRFRFRVPVEFLAALPAVIAIVAAIVVALLFGGPSDAHHSFAMFDRSRTDQVVGTVKAFDMINPHGWLVLTVPGADGKPREWSLETGGQGQLARAGWQEKTVSPGDKVTATIHPLKDGSNGGQLISVVLPNGQSLRAGPGGFGGGR